jgi:hypothetical protein
MSHRPLRETMLGHRWFLLFFNLRQYRNTGYVEYPLSKVVLGKVELIGKDRMPFKYKDKKKEDLNQALF